MNAALSIAEVERLTGQSRRCISYWLENGKFSRPLTREGVMRAIKEHRPRLFTKIADSVNSLFQESAPTMPELREALDPEALRGSAVDWIESNVIVPGSGGTRLTLWPWQSELVRIVLSKNRPELITVRKGTQIGGTLTMWGLVSWHLKQGLSCAWFMSKQSEARRLYRTFIRPAIKSTGQLSELYSDGPMEQAIFKNGAELLVRFAGSEADLSGITTDLLIMDELDKYQLDVQGAGNPVALGLKRVRARGGCVVLVSSPSGQGGVLRQAEESSALHFKYHVGCPDCGGLFLMSWDVLIANDAAHPCLHCGSALDVDALPAMLAAGRWQTDDGQFSRDGCLVGSVAADSHVRESAAVAGEWPSRVSFEISGLQSLITGAWRSGVEDLRGAAASKDPETQLAEANTTRGEFWSDSTKHDADDLLERRRALKTPESWLRTAGVDVQDDRLEAMLCAWSPRESCHILRHDVLEGATSDHSRGAWLSIEGVAAGAWAQGLPGRFGRWRKRR